MGIAEPTSLAAHSCQRVGQKERIWDRTNRRLRAITTLLLRFNPEFLHTFFHALPSMEVAIRASTFVRYGIEVTILSGQLRDRGGEWVRRMVDGQTWHWLTMGWLLRRSTQFDRVRTRYIGNCSQTLAICRLNNVETTSSVPADVTGVANR